MGQNCRKCPLTQRGFADAANAVDGALAFDDDGAFGGEVLAEFGEELIAAFEQGPGKR